MNEYLFDEFEAYTENRMPPIQLKAFDERLQQDSTFRLALADYQQFRHSIEAVKLKQQLETIHNRLDRQGDLQDRRLATPFVRPLWEKLAIAAIVLLVVAYGLFLALRPSLSERIFMAYYQAEPVSRGANLCGPELGAGLQAYRSGRFSQALTVFSQLPANLPCVRYYRGLSQLALGHTTLAIDELQQTIKQVKKPSTTDISSPMYLTGQKAEWFLALAYLKANRTDDARKLLDTLASQDEHPFHAVALKVLADLQHD